LVGRSNNPDETFGVAELTDVATVEELAGVLRRLRRRHARQRGDSPLTYRELAAKTGWAHGVIGGYFTGKTLAPTDRFDVLVELLGVTATEQFALATARDRVEERRRDKDIAQDGPRAEAVDRVVPRELPSDVFEFTGRQDQLAELDGLLLADTDASAVVISAVAGTAGVGKTALAVHWAHRAADRFPDGCLYVDLRGYGPDRPVRPDDALAMLLRSLGMSDAHIPHGSAERAARYRTMVAGRRMLIVFDNANRAEQVRPLLPGTASCRTVITSRDHLAGLVARDGARRVDLDTLPDNDSLALLHALIGRRAQAEPDAVRALAAYCCGLPLALRIAAEHAIARPDSDLVDLVAELADQRRRLDALDARADEDTAIRAVFSWSYRALSTDAARTFRLVGLHPGRDLDIYSIAAVTGGSVAQARRRVDELAQAFLIRQSTPGRYTMHDLLRAYAAEQAAADADRTAALARLFDHYLHTAALAMNLAFPADAAHRPPAPRVRTPVPALDDKDGALTWLDAELGNLIAMATDATRRDWPRYTTGLSRTLGRYLYVGSHHAEALALHEQARDVAVRLADASAEAGASRQLGTTYDMLARYPDALAHYRRALDIYLREDDDVGRGDVLTDLAVVHVRLGRLDEARRCCLAALEIHRTTGNTSSEGITLNNLGYICTSLGHYEEALGHLRAGLEIRGAAGEPGGGTCTLVNLGNLHARLGQYTEALDYHQQALDVHRTAHDRVGEGETLSYLGETYLRSGRLDQARERLGEALEISRATGDRGSEAHTLNVLGETLRALGDGDDAAERHEAARVITIEIGDDAECARALRGIGHVRYDELRWHAAREHWTEALTIYADLGLPEADQVRELLTALDEAESTVGGAERTKRGIEGGVR
jgi:tetratricopeptide (TPR) repeat protein